MIVDSTSDCGESDEGRKRGCAAAIKVLVSLDFMTFTQSRSLNLS